MSTDNFLHFFFFHFRCFRQSWSNHFIQIWPSLKINLCLCSYIGIKLCSINPPNLRPHHWLYLHPHTKSFWQLCSVLVYTEKECSLNVLELCEFVCQKTRAHMPMGWLTQRYCLAKYGAIPRKEQTWRWYAAKFWMSEGYNNRFVTWQHSHIDACYK